MGREIKFRGKRVDTKKWVHGYYFKTPLTDENSGTQPEVGWFFLSGETRHCISEEHGVAFVIIPETVSEYTGMKDKNGKEIYEGDIVRYWNGVAPIEYNMFGFAIKYSDDEYFDINEPDKIEVIGNIYDNANLLN